MRNSESIEAPDAQPQTLAAVPLARDRDDRPVPVPEGAVAWQVRRHTGGRPRIYVDGSKRPMQLSLTYTLADLDEILPPGTYRLDLVNAEGKALGLTIKINVGEDHSVAAGGAQLGDDNDDNIEDDASVSLATRSDMRFILDANVRSMQLAFQHNERTLASGLRMADTLREGIQTLAEAQGEWIKSLVAARGFPRNGWQTPTPAPALVPPREDDRDEDVDDDDDTNANGNAGKYVEFGVGIMTLVNNLMAQFMPPKRPDVAAASGAESATSTANFDWRSLLDWRRAAKTKAVSDGGSALPPAETPSIQSVLASMPPSVLGKLMEVRSKLDPDEQARVMAIVAEIPTDELPAITASLEKMSTDEIVSLFRTQLAKQVGGQ